MPLAAAADTAPTAKRYATGLSASGFQATYYDRWVPIYYTQSAEVSEIAMNYGFPRELGGLEPSRFAATWKGSFRFSEPTTKLISVSQSHAHTRISIGGSQVFKGKKSGAFLHEFSAGEHQIEVLHENYWHTVGVKVTFQEPVPTLEEQDFTHDFRDVLPDARELIYAGLYAATAMDHSVHLELGDEDQGRVLWLDSNGAIDWKLNKDPGLRAVVVASYEPGARVLGLNSDTPVFNSKLRFGNHVKFPLRCSCSPAGFHCYGRGEMDDIAGRIKGATGAELVAVAEKKSEMRVSLVPYDRFEMILEKSREDVAHREAVCERLGYPDYDRYFKNASCKKTTNETSPRAASCAQTTEGAVGSTFSDVSKRLTSD